MPQLCLIVAADAGLAATLRAELPAFGIKPCLADHLDAAVAMLQQWSFDAVILCADRVVPSTLRYLRGSSRLPLLLLTSAVDETSHIRALESGASDVVALPASARLIATKLRRLAQAADAPGTEPRPEVQLGPLRMNPRLGFAAVEGAPLSLTPQQFDLLYMLAAHPGVFVQRHTIAAALRGSGSEVGRSADVQVSRLRKKLREAGVAGLHIDTIHGRGYCLSLDDTSPLADDERSNDEDDCAVA